MATCVECGQQCGSRLFCAVTCVERRDGRIRADARRLARAEGWRDGMNWAAQIADKKAEESVDPDRSVGACCKHTWLNACEYVAQCISKEADNLDA